MTDVRIREAHLNDLDRVTEIEAICFPTTEAAPKETLKERLEAFTKSFFVAEVDGKIIGFINGCATNSPAIYDEMFHSTSHHISSGENLSVFGLDVIPEFQRQGVAAMMMNHFIQAAKYAGHMRVILTCKDKLVHYYESLGFVNHGISESTHGEAQWFNMTFYL